MCGGFFYSRESLQNDRLTLNFTCHFKVAINQQQSIFFNTSLKGAEERTNISSFCFRYTLSLIFFSCFYSIKWKEIWQSCSSQTNALTVSPAFPEHSCPYSSWSHNLSQKDRRLRWTMSLQRRRTVPLGTTSEWEWKIFNLESQLSSPRYWRAAPEFRPPPHPRQLKANGSPWYSCILIKWELSHK